jgi:ubiquitin carboxyl-terminal hydrolase 8
LSVERLEESMSIAPKHEQGVFSNRDKFDLIVVYDEASTSYGPKDSSLSVLVRLIGEQAIQKMLKRMPMLLVGGMEAWRRDMGDSEIIRGSGILSPEPQKSFFTDNPIPLSPLMLSSSPRSKNPFLVNGSIPAASSSMGNSSNDPHQVWTPRPRSDSNTGGFDLRSPTIEHHPQYSLDQIPNHSRFVPKVSPKPFYV